jgi:hypothetical protein
LRYIDCATKRVSKITTLSAVKYGVGGISVSPDGKTILYTQTDSLRAEIMVVDDFH